MSEGAWYQLEFALTPTAAEFYINGANTRVCPQNLHTNLKNGPGELIGRSCQRASVLDGAATVNLTLGGFDGYLDDVAISTVVRAPPSGMLTDSVSLSLCLFLSLSLSLCVCV
eukprot:COSAG03_NODE_7549_length_902_cov_1.288917_2_plen_113_part_00